MKLHVRTVEEKLKDIGLREERLNLGMHVIKNERRICMTETVFDLINKYAEKHPLALECGSEYIYQDNEAQVDAIKLVADIFDNLIP